MLGIFLALTSCSEFTEVGSDIIESSGTFNIAVKEFELPTRQIRYSNLNTTNTEYVYLGSHQDNLTGELVATTYTQLTYSSVPSTLVDTLSPVFESAYLELKASTGILTGGEESAEIVIRQLSEPIFDDAIYRANDTIKVHNDFIVAKGEVSTDTSRGAPFSVVNVDSLYFDSLGSEALVKMLLVDDVELSRRRIANNIMGFAFSSSSSSSLLGIDLDSIQVKVVYNHLIPDDDTGLRDRDTIVYAFGNGVYTTRRFNNFRFNSNNAEFQNSRFFEAYGDSVLSIPAAGIHPVVDFSGYLNFIDSVKSSVDADGGSLRLNLAELTLDGIQNDVYDGFNHITFNYWNEEVDGIPMLDGSASFSTLSGGVATPSNVTFENEEFRYITTQTFEAIKNLDESDRFDMSNVVVFPGSANIVQGSNIQRSIFDRSTFRLKVYYSIQRP